jgi:hypothetical protein
VCLAALACAASTEERESLQPPIDATLELSGRNIAAGVGFAWGGGKLTYKGKEYAVAVDGLTVGSIGVTAIEATGTVHHLAKLEDFDGSYTAAVAGSTVGGGGAWLVMRNQKNVEVRMHATTQGVSLTIGTSGVKLALAK